MTPAEREVFKAARTYNRRTKLGTTCGCGVLVILALIFGGISYGVYAWVHHINTSHDERLQREADDKQQMIEWEKAHPTPKVEPR